MENLLKEFAKRSLNSVLSKIWQNPHAQFTTPAAMNRILRHRFQVNTVVDLGASDGRWSVETMQYFPKARFLGFEPLAEREEALRQTKISYPQFDYVIAAAGSSNDAEISLSVSEDLDGSTVGGSGANRRPVPCVTLDFVLADRALDGPYLLKFDTHGFEEEILLGSTTTLQDTSVIIMEVYNFDISEFALRFPEICLRLETLGFRCFDMANPSLRTFDGCFWQMDLLFCRSESPIFSHRQYS